MSRYMNWKGALILVVVLAIIVVGAWVLLSSEDDEGDEPEPAELTMLTVSGSGGTTAILEAIKPAFEADTPGYQLEMLTGTGTGGGVQGVVDGTLDVAAMARPPKDDEAVEYVEFGRSGQALYVHDGVGDIDLTSEQASAIVFGEITNWSEVGGPDMGIVLYVRDEGDSSTAALRESIFGDEPFAETAQVMTSQGDMINAVEGIEGAVGFGTWPAALAAGANVRPISLDGVKPTDTDYPITGALGIGFLAEHQTDVQPLIDWLISDTGKTTLREIGVIVD
jgi:phosphate transport system substrate-binding protein